MMNICMIANGHDYVIELAILIVSILQNSDEEDNFYFHIITEYMDELDKNKLIQLKKIKKFNIKFYKPINVEKYTKWVEIANGKIPKNWNHNVFYKLDIPDILSDLDKVLYLDTDMIVLKSIKNIFSLDISKYYVAVADNKSNIDKLRYDGLKLLAGYNSQVYDAIQKTINDFKFMMDKALVNKEVDEWFNSGFMYMNLKKLRENIKDVDIDNYFKFIIDKDIVFSDEVFYNYFINKDKILLVSRNYNAQLALFIDDKYTEDIIIAHFTGCKLLNSNIYMECKNQILYKGYKYLTFTEWFKENPFLYIDKFIIYENYKRNNKTEYKIKKLIDTLAWFIPIRKWRDNFRNKFNDNFIGGGVKNSLLNLYYVKNEILLTV